MASHTETAQAQQPSTRNGAPDTGVEHSRAVAGALSDVLSDTYLLLIKTHAYHWNVVGPLFYSIHKLTEEQYTDMFGAIDVMAERVRALGRPAPGNVAEMRMRSDLGEGDVDASALEMVEELARDHEKLSRRLHNVAATAAKAHDIVTEDLAVTRSAFHEKAVWMLRSIATL